MKRSLLIILVVIMAISMSAGLTRGWKNVTTGADSLLGAADTVDCWMRYSDYRNFYDKWNTFGAEYTIIGGDTASIGITFIGYALGDSIMQYVWDATFTDDSMFQFNAIGVDTVGWMIMWCDSFLIRCISTAEASDSLAIELYLGYATFNQERW